MIGVSNKESLRKMEDWVRRALRGTRVVDRVALVGRKPPRLERVVLVGVALAGATMVALLPRLLPCGDTPKDPYPRYAEHAEI